MKFQDLKQGGQKIAGTNQSIRKKVMKPILENHPDQIKIRIKNQDFTLKADWSTSGKTVSYWSSITPEQYMLISGSDYGLSKSKKRNPSIVMWMDGRIDLYGGNNYTVKIMSNEGIEIL